MHIEQRLISNNTKSKTPLTGDNGFNGGVLNCRLLVDPIL
jgi:hypothetical protein